MHEGLMNQISLVFDTISLKRISPLTQSLWHFETHKRLPPRIKWSTARKLSTQGCALQTTQCLFLSLWHKLNAQKYSHFESFFLFLKSSFYEWGTMKTYTLLNRHSISVITTMHRLTDLKIKIIKYCYLNK